MPAILVVDDDRRTVGLVRLYLEREGHAVRAAHDGQEALELARAAPPDLVVLDLMLPRLDGLDVCQALRGGEEPLRRVPIIMLTARTTEEEKLLGLDLGADDYLTKPFSPRELVARVRAVLRRVGEEGERIEPPASFEGGALVVDFGRHEARLDGAQIALTPKELRLLFVLARTPGRAFSRAELLERAFGYDYEGLERTVDVHLSSLRRKLGRPYLATVYGVGYKLVARPDAA